ncbi:peptidoglycan DD-metalloendopeptidase family protein [Nocardia farcinica]|uniref:peptidoglycan DD-metalloendopeptidase family protein n=1 Tax=Nocardia farcinica TaxID=37329 RepID=UPI001893DB3B|nr:peptidoglycan DD-metalloendopeptidase family protein [Nocardia farcinica]MBF6411193.1 peptidoglycan DD-metalloendopeptidase family protein [Nocardia farcinica]
MPDRYWPLGAGRVVTSGFGERWGGVHWGVDFGREGGSGGMPVYAAQAGTVVNAGPASGFGQWVVIDHPTEAGSGTTVYGHVLPAVSVGEYVQAGQRIAVINPNGTTNGGVAPHLHFEVHRDVWRPPGPGRLDPLPWLTGAREPGPAPSPPKSSPAPPKEAPVLDSPITRSDLSGNCHSGGRNVSWVAIHTQEGRGEARDIVPYLKNPAPGGDPARAVSYNAVVDDSETVLVVPWHLNPWSASNANSRADHILMAGTFAAWQRGKWLERDTADGVDEDMMLTRTAELVAWRCLQRGLPIEYVGGTGEYPPRRPGICGHVDFGAWGGGHTDPGSQFPWDELIRRARAFAEGDEMSGIRFTNFEGVEVDAATALKWIDQRAWQNERMLVVVLDQLLGPGAGEKIRDQAGAEFEAWKQNGGRSLNDLTAAIGAAVGVPGTRDTKGEVQAK